MLTIGSACTGIGGLEAGLLMAGLGPVLWQCEVDRYCRSVLRRHWPTTRRLTNVHAIPSADIPVPDIFVAGFPCQDISQANPDGEGLAGARSGLFWACLDAVDALAPRVVAFENVGRLARRDLDIVGAELTDRGFAVDVTRLRAEDVGAPHQRERVFIVAYAHGGQLQRGGELGELASSQRAPQEQGLQRERDGDAPRHCGSAGDRPLGHADRQRLEGVELPGATSPATVLTDGAAGERAPQSGMGGAVDGLSDRLDRARWPAPRFTPRYPYEPPILVAGYPGRRAQVKALGNAVVPYCGYVVGLRIRQVLGLPPPG